MVQVWRNMSDRGIAGLIHPDDHFSHDKGGAMRRVTYPRLRRHWGFVNELKLFEDVSDTDTYGIHIYARPASNVKFINACSLFHSSTIDQSLLHDGTGEVPGIQHEFGGWDIRPHRDRIIHVDETTLRDWCDLFEAGSVSPLEARMPNVTSVQQAEALAAIGATSERMAGNYLWTRCWDEDKLKSGGYAVWDPQQPQTLDRLVLQPPHIGLSNPFAKQPPLDNQGSSDFRPVNIVALDDEFIPTSNYRLTADASLYESGIRRWGDARVTDFWRLAWRRRLGQNMERTLNAALLAPGIPHVEPIHTLIATAKDGDGGYIPLDAVTVMLVGMWSSIPFDYLVKLSGADDLTAGRVDHLPLRVSSPCFEFILHRSLRLNCLTRAYAPICSP